MKRSGIRSWPARLAIDIITVIIACVLAAGAAAAEKKASPAKAHPTGKQSTTDQQASKNQAANLPGAQGAFHIEGIFVEGCSCAAPCPCEMTGVKMGCQGVGALSIDKGNYKGVSLADVKIAYAMTPGQWVRLYIDAPEGRPHDAAGEFAQAVYKSFGPIKEVTDAPISITGHAGRYTVLVAKGNIMQLETQPVLGGDKRTPIGHTNLADPLNATLFQGRTVNGHYRDQGVEFTLAGSNAYFNHLMKSSGKI